ncbi:hypothetical protein [Allorhizobium terrae]|uniref:Uncharacterized protein n=1 Tax=Allorhizobium terrae TaxID=1848972 RepID=A0A4S3ZWV2_9HYPH|nr:hypothetical protein [Allorhizobium terrae]THF50234.1 hypothetical protein E6C51_10845 [Allorhizobium terrae]
MSKDSAEKKRRRRTCADHMRLELARRRERRSDPAGKVMLQILALLSVVLALAPPVPAPAFDLPRLRPRRSPWDPPAGYPNGREAWARERGLEPEPGRTPLPISTPHVRPTPAPRPWKRLVRDLDSRSEQRREQAREQMLRRVPDEARPWLRGLITSEDRTALRMLGLGADRTTLRDRALVAARVAPTFEDESTPAVEIEAAPVPGRK